ncbi:MAG: hypothetical protein HC787_00430 [Nostocaceae cyanobacterium CSU_2_110]|nr:hypothetical protein [Nostocaceae cyanobacterium CSU_2_110]
MASYKYKLSSQGMKAVEEARVQKGWKRTSKMWAETGVSSVSTLKRFLKGEPISADHFMNLCKAVGLEDWQSLFEQQDSDSTRVFGFKNESDKDGETNGNGLIGILTVSGSFSKSKRKQIEELIEVLRELLMDGARIRISVDIDDEQ